VGIEAVRAAVLPLAASQSKGDDAFLTRCLLSRTDGPLLGLHILAAISEDSSNRVHAALKSAGCDLDLLAKNAWDSLGKKKGALTMQGIAVKEIANPLLDFGRDLTECAERGEFDALCDRPEEVRRLTEVLLRKEKGNPAITGNAGVGKTALVELFARHLANRDVPDPLVGTKLFEVSMARLVAGTKYRGDFEERMEKVMKAALDWKPAILFIDEMHLIWGAGRAEGVIMDAANILKPFLSRGNFRVIGATTVEEFHRFIMQDAALARRFQELRIEEPDAELVQGMVASQAASLAAYHSVSIDERIVDDAIELTDRYVPGRFQPDKSVDLLDVCCVDAVRSGKRELTAADLRDTLARQTGMPVSSVTGDLRKRLRGIASEISRRIIGQPEAVGKVAATFIQRRQGLGSDHRHLGSFLFAGPSGVGKTELARVAADVLFGKRGSLLVIDLGEYNQSGSVNRLIGSPAGYVGSDKDGFLVDWLHTNGVGVILFDEIDKAHPDIHSLILGLLDTGRITSSKGERLDARQCVIILTTNAVRQEDLVRASIGFARDVERPRIEDVLAEHFPVEFLGRLDEQILFNGLTNDDMVTIIRGKLEDAVARLARQNVTLSFDGEALSRRLLDFIREDGSGARGIERVIEKRILQPVSIALLHREEEDGDVVVLGENFIDDGVIEFGN
jgi:ATP-dependent Clp protease ATP-binding subunit ClpC